MTQLFDTPIATGGLVLLVVALLVACAFEFVNGFHDTANAVATVIYTNALKPSVAVVWSGIFNLLGVTLGGIAVAMSIIKLLPVELLSSSGSGAGLAMVLALLVAAIAWNLGTWWFGLPASSSHTLIGAIVGVGLANSLMPGHTFGSGINWHKVQEIGLSLIVSPLFGLGAAALLLVAARKFFAKKALHSPPEGKKPPPLLVRALLIGTCTGVSFAHGSNDGQKGVGLIMLILIGILPADFALNTAFNKTNIDETVAITRHIDTTTREVFGEESKLASIDGMQVEETPASKVLNDLAHVRSALAGKESVRDIPPEERFDIRNRIMRIDSTLSKLEADKSGLTAEQLAALKKDRSQLRSAIDYAPFWVMILVALSLGIGTMVGWKRIVVTVGEKIGKSHLTYAQGASAELVAMSTIGLAGWFGWPVSTTHVLSSGIAGTMVAQKSGLQGSTVRNIALAWLLTLPVAVVLAGGLFLGFRAIIPDAKAETVNAPAVHFDPKTEEAVVSTPLAGKPLRLHGSTTLGAQLAPDLAQGLLRSRGATDVEAVKGESGHAWVVRGHVPGEKDVVEVEIDAEGSTTAFEDLFEKRADVGLASRAVTQDEAEKLARAGFGDARAVGQENVVALDGIAVVVSPKSAITELTVEDVGHLFAGEPTAVAGAEPLHVLARDDRSGTFDTFKGLVLGDRALTAHATRFADSDALVAALMDDPRAIGFVPMAKVGHARAVALSESGAAAVLPSPFAVATEDYPLTRRLYVYASARPAHPLARAFVDFAVSAAGQRIVAADGFVDLLTKANEKQADLCKSCPAGYGEATHLATRLSVSFRFRAGSTSLDSRAAWDLERLSRYLQTQGSPSVMLLGFSDSEGAEDANLALSRDRAKGVAAKLEAYGVKVLRTEGFGSALPVASNASPAGRDRNRRVEVWLPAK